MGKGKLTSKEYWDSVSGIASLPQINSPEIFNYYGTLKFIEPVLMNAGKKTFLEVGCGSSGWLPYFAEKYNYIVSGIDYSEVGCRLSERNLKMLNVAYDEIICEDIFKWVPDKKYDVVFNYGVIEHFENPGSILKIIYNSLKNNGIIKAVVPNLQGVFGFLFKRVARNIHDMHKVISKEKLKEIHEENGFINIKTEYIGPFFFNSAWRSSQHWIFKEKTIRRKITIALIYRINQLIGNIQNKLNIEISNSNFSPYVIAIMKKD